MNKELKQVLEQIIALPDTGFNAYAVTYAKAALCNPFTGCAMTGEELRVQLLYVSSNLQYWRGPEARASKLILKKYIKEVM